MADVIWDRPKTTQKIIWDKPAVSTSITWDKPEKSNIVWNKSEEEKSQIKWSTDPWQRMSLFMKTLDILGRPAQAMKSLFAQVQKENLGKSYSERLRQKPQTKKRFEALWKGFTGQERHTTNELWANLGIKGVPFLGFITEIAVDPLMAAGGAGYKAIFKAPTKAIKVGIKGLQKVPGVTKVGTATAQKIQPVTQGLKNLFVTKTGIGKLGELIDKHLSKRAYLTTKEMWYGTKVRNVIQNISRKSGRSIDDIERQIITLIEQPDITLKGALPKCKTLANVLRNHFEMIITQEMKAGVPITYLSAGSRNIQYFPRITTAEATRYLKQARIGNSRVWNVKLANALKRKTGDFTLQEFNDFVVSHGLKSLGGRAVEEFFIKNPAYAVTIRGIRSAKAVTSAQFLDDVAKQFGLKKAPSFWQELPESIVKLNPNLRGMKFDPEVAGEILRTTKRYINPHELGAFRRGYDTILNTWKRWILTPFPKYHLRNIVGNLWNVYLEGTTRPIHFMKMQALQMYRKYRGTGKPLERFAIGELRKVGITNLRQADNLILNMEKTGVMGRGWYAADIETGIKLGKKGLIERGMAFGTTVENNARGALFLSRLDQGDDIYKAALSVKKHLFDYQDLTFFEREVMKRLMPFYTWSRKNIPLQLEYLFKTPEKFMRLAIPLRARDEQDLLRLKYARPDLWERFPIELRRVADAVTYVPLEGLIPAGDLAKIIRPKELFIELVSPYLRVPIELMMNKSFYFESEIQRYPAETQELLRMEIPIKLKYALVTILPQARMLNEINKLVRKQIKKEKLTIGEQLFAQSLSSIYKIGIKDLRDRALSRVNKKMRDLESGFRWAKRYERTREQQRIKQTYEKLKKLIKEIKGQGQ